MRHRLKLAVVLDSLLALRYGHVQHFEVFVRAVATQVEEVTTVLMLWESRRATTALDMPVSVHAVRSGHALDAQRSLL